MGNWHIELILLHFNNPNFCLGALNFIGSKYQCYKQNITKHFTNTSSGMPT